MASYLDSFNRADQAGLGTSSQGTWSWSTNILDIGQINIVSNQAKQQNGTLTGIHRAQIDLASSDNYAQALIVNRGTNASSNAGVCCRFGTNTFYLALVSQNSVSLFRYSSSTYTQIGSTATVTVSLPQVIRVEAVGSSIKAYWNGVLVVSGTDSIITTGLRGGLRMGGSGGGTQCIVDDFKMGDLPEPAAGAGRQTFIINA